MPQILAPSAEEVRSAVLSKVAIVTGAAQGIGFAIAELLAISGAEVIIADFDENLGKQAANKIGHGTVFVKCDVTSWSNQINLFQQTIEIHGRIDLVICNAGINPELMASPDLQGKDSASAKYPVKYDFLSDILEEKSPNLLRCPTNKIFDVNVTGVVYNMKLAIYHMVRDGGRIIVIGSAGSYLAIPNQPLYAASKHAVLGLIRATSRRTYCLENGISVSMVAPFITETRMTTEISKELPESVVISSVKDITSAVGMAVTLPQERINGKSLWVQGHACIEVEDVIMDCHDMLMASMLST